MKKLFVLLFLLFPLSSFAKDYPTGLIFDDITYQNTPRSATLISRDYKILPSSSSLQSYIPRVGNQKQTGTCTAWATAYGARTILESVALGRINRSKSSQQVFSPSYIYNQIRQKDNCSEGTYIDDALNILKYQGVAKFNVFGFDCNKEVHLQDKQQAAPYKIQGYKPLFGLNNDANKLNSVKKALAEKNPVIIGMATPVESFSKARMLWKPTKSDYAKKNWGGHAMVVIAYDNNRYGGSFQLMNSWGEAWGDHGLIWITYNDFLYFVRNAYEVIPKPVLKQRVTITSEIKFIQSNKQVMPIHYNPIKQLYQMNKPYSSGTRFNFFIKNKQATYLYAFGIDTTKKIFTIFPHNNNISPFLSYKNSSIALPDEEHYVKMDKTIGKDYFIILYSLKALDIEKIKKLVEKSKGELYSRIRNSLNKLNLKLVKGKEVDFNHNYIQFQYNTVITKKNSTVVAVIVEFEHI